MSCVYCGGQTSGRVEADGGIACSSCATELISDLSDALVIHQSQLDQQLQRIRELNACLAQINDMHVRLAKISDMNLRMAHIHDLAKLLTDFNIKHKFES